MIVTIISAVANDNTYFYLLLLAAPLLALSNIADLALLVTLIMYLVRRKPQGKNKIIAIVALVLLTVWIAWGIVGFLPAFVDTSYEY